jgi:hypothetical protein
MARPLNSPLIQVTPPTRCRWLFFVMFYSLRRHVKSALVSKSIYPSIDHGTRSMEESELCSRLAPYFRAHSRLLYICCRFGFLCTMQSTTARVLARSYVHLFRTPRTKPYLLSNSTYFPCHGTEFRQKHQKYSKLSIKSGGCGKNGKNWENPKNRLETRFTCTINQKASYIGIDHGTKKWATSELCSRLAPYFRAHSRFLYVCCVVCYECTMQSTTARVLARFYVHLFRTPRTKPYLLSSSTYFPCHGTECMMIPYF